MSFFPAPSPIEAPETMSYPSCFEMPATPPYEQAFIPYDHAAAAAKPLLHDASPATMTDTLPTPVKSPVRQHGPMLLPRIRSQDQTVESVLDSSSSPPPPPMRHRKALSCTYNPPASMLQPASETLRRSTSPGNVFDWSSPNPAPMLGSCMSSAMSSPISITSSVRSTHSRRASGSQIDERILAKYGYPTYRAMPLYIPGPTYTNVAGASTFVPPPIHVPRAQSLPLDFQFADDGQTTTMFDYLTEANPSPALVQQVKLYTGRGVGQLHYWWDIRNLRPWTDFTLQTIEEIPGLMPLLKVGLPQSALPPVSVDRSKMQPETEAALFEMYRHYYTAKINHALRMSQGQVHMVMRAEKGVFKANYQEDVNLLGGARVVGIVKSFDRWHTGMRKEAPHRKVEYLLGLSHLQHVMRQNNCRYGFIMTEIELVCVRAGTEEVPYFGHLEVAEIPLNENKNGLTAGLALWYLHMLAKEMALPGQAGWKTEVGGPAACTRQKCMQEKDSWIPEPQLGERRTAKRERGWIFPKDPLHRKELPAKGKKRAR